jgi:ABC-type transport system involved in cytochrome bd biosynthesis fused ATPase/permease subunit
VLQHGRTMSGSIFENITGGLPYSLDDAWKAARLAGIDREIASMPMGMHTLLLEGAPTLSGGQRQRLMIARAVIGKPQILLFDEATSALDNVSQPVVTDTLSRLQATRIEIAHRLSTNRDSDRIFVNDRNSDSAPAYAVANARVGYEWSCRAWRFSAFARLNNLFDRRYAGSVIVGDTNGRFFEPAPGRNWFVGASVEVRL